MNLDRPVPSPLGADLPPQPSVGPPGPPSPCVRAGGGQRTHLHLPTSQEENDSRRRDGVRMTGPPAPPPQGPPWMALRGLRCGHVTAATLVDREAPRPVWICGCFVQQPKKVLANKRLQRQVAGLRQQLQTQQAHWAAVLRDLQTQMDALKEQTPGPLGPDASTSAASAQPRRDADTPAAKPACGRGSPPSAGEDTTRKHAAQSRSAPLLGRALSPRSAPSSQPISVTVERIESGNMVSYEGADKVVSIRLLIRRAAPARPGLRAEGKPALREVAKNLPVEPASSPGTARPTGTGTEKEGQAARCPAGQVGRRPQTRPPELPPATRARRPASARPSEAGRCFQNPEPQASRRLGPHTQPRGRAPLKQDTPGGGAGMGRGRAAGRQGGKVSGASAGWGRDASSLGRLRAPSLEPEGQGKPSSLPPLPLPRPERGAFTLLEMDV